MHRIHSRRLAMLVAAVLISAPLPAMAVATNDGPVAEDAEYAVATAAIKIAHYEEALVLLSGLLQRHPEDPDVLNLTGFSLRKLGRTGEALAYYRRALDRDPAHPGANEYLGELYLELGQIDQARERLAALGRACASRCPEFLELQAAIAKALRGVRAE